MTATLPYSHTQNGSMILTNHLPYETDGKYELSRILSERHEIPYHSRHFMWTEEKYIGHTVREALKKFRMNRAHWMGFVIVYNGSQKPSISDAQHRLTVYTLMIVAIAALRGKPKLLKKVCLYREEDDEDDIDPEDATILAKHGWRHFPNIHSCYEEDFVALGSVINGIQPTKAQLKSSNIYAAYESIKRILSAELTDDDSLRLFLTFIEKNTIVTRMVISDWDFALEAFDSINNIKLQVPPVYLIKNAIVRRLGEAASEEVHNVFAAYETTFGKRFEQTIHTAVNIMLKRFVRNDLYAAQFTEHIGASTYTGNPLSEFCAVMERIRDTRAAVTNDRFGRLVLQLITSHELMDLCVIPMSFMGDVSPLLRWLVAFAVRTFGSDFSFNTVSIQAVLKDLVADVLQEGQHFIEGMDAIRTQLTTWSIYANINGEPYDMTTHLFRTPKQQQAARCFLFYLAEVTDSHEATLEYNRVDLEHISPQHPRADDAPLANTNDIHRLGNLTLFVARNSGPVKGNRGLSNRPYVEKREHYAKSNVAMTREVAGRYSRFRSAEIEERTSFLVQQLNDISAVDLNLE
jgi:hypothetical protein